MSIFITKNYTYKPNQMFLMQMFHEFISCKWINLQKPRYYDESYDEKLKITVAETGIFRGRTGFLEQKHFDKHLMHNT